MTSTYSASTVLRRLPLAHFSSYAMNVNNIGVGAACSGTCTRPLPPPRIGMTEVIPKITPPLFAPPNRTQAAAPIAPLRVVYRSDRVKGRKDLSSVDLHLTDVSIPASLVRVELAINVAGQEYREVFNAAPSLKVTRQWDGLDRYGRRLQGQQDAQIDVVYVYSDAYGEARDIQHFALTIGTMDPEPQGFGQFDLAEHMTFDPIHNRLYGGDGRIVDKRVLGARTLDYYVGARDLDESDNPGESPCSWFFGGDPNQTTLGKTSPGLTSDGEHVLWGEVFDRRDESGFATVAILDGPGAPVNIVAGVRGYPAQLTQPVSNITLVAYDARSALTYWHVRRLNADRSGDENCVLASRNQSGSNVFVIGCHDAASGTRDPDYFPLVAMAGSPQDGITYASDGEDVYLWSDDADARALFAENVAARSLFVTPEGELLAATATDVGRIGPNGTFTVFWANAGTNISSVVQDSEGNVYVMDEGGRGGSLEGIGSRLRMRDVANNETELMLGTNAAGVELPLSGTAPWAVNVQTPHGLTIDGNDDLYFFVGRDDALSCHGHAIYRATAPRALVRSNGELVTVDSKTGNVFVFDAAGRHLRTLHAWTGGVIRRFAYL